jgi:hypothetical protein
MIWLKNCPTERKSRKNLKKLIFWFTMNCFCIMMLREHGSNNCGLHIPCQ